MPSILITEDKTLAAHYQSNDGCVLGIAETDDPSQAVFEDADALVLSWDALTERFLRLTMCHRYRVPYIVASTHRLIIRESMPADYEAIRAMLQCCPDNALTKEFADEISGDPRENDHEASAWFLSYTATAYAFFGYGLWSVIKKEDGRVIGWSGLFPSKEEGTSGYSIEMGYLIAEEERRQGYGYEACKTICDYACEELGCDRLCLHIAPENEPSAALAGKLGFGQAPDDHAGSHTGFIRYEKVLCAQ